ncbi:ribosome biogenesis GTPase Der [Archangium gephyra]|uniref:ribosome biogenesis GTPase Der n=1 Tax=Archangium gephyra TaxID=48 RepID=UPI0035D3DC29
MKPLVAIVGRPNVGKSTLFNRLARRRIALVEDQPGVTRDRHYWDVDYDGRDITIIDTGGFVPGEKDSLLQQVREQAQLAVEECDAIIFVTDARVGLTSADQDVATYLRQSGKPVVVAANKLDTESGTMQSLAGEFFKLGLGDVFPISAEHGLGVGSMMETVMGKLPPLSPEELAAREQADKAEEAAEEGEEGAEGEEAAPAEEEDRPIRVAIIGRPNVGKSTLVNALLKQKRVVASEIPGTTRDPIDSELTYKDRKVILTDTAGIRRKKTIAHRVEKFSVVAALKSLDRSDVAVLLMDATEPAVDQDAKLAGIAEEKGRALVIVVNKWDLISTDKRKQELFREDLKHALKFVHYAPIVFTSALTGSKVEKVLELAVELAVQFRYRAPTPQLNRLLEHMADNHPAPIVGRGPLRLYYMAQVGTAPPTFAITCNRPDGVPDMYKRYITNQLRGTFDLRVPIRLLFRDRPGQAKRAARKRPKLAGKSKH